MIYGLLILSVLLGIIIVFWLRPKSKNSIKLTLTFSGGYLLAITVLHLIPDAYENNSSNIGLYVLLGFLIQCVLEFFSKGIEHGHVHNNNGFHTSSLLAVILSLCVHSFIEAMPINLDGNINSSLLTGILIHKIPISIVLGNLLFNSTINRLGVLFVLFIFIISAPLGLLTGNYISGIYPIGDNLTGIVIGILLHISTTIIFESSENHRFNFLKLTTIIIAFTLAYLS